MKTLNTKALAIALLFSSATVFAAGEGNTSTATTANTTDANATTQDANAKKANVLRRAYNYVSGKAAAGRDAVQAKISANPKTSVLVAAATGAAAFKGAELLYNYFGQSQAKAKAKLLKALEAKEFDKVEKAFNKLNKDSKAKVKASFDAYSKAVKAVASAHPRRKARFQTFANNAHTAFVNAVKALEAKTGFDIKAKADKVVAKAKEYKKTTIAVASALALGAYELVNYKWIPKNWVTVRNAYNKVKARFAKTPAATTPEVTTENTEETTTEDATSTEEVVEEEGTVEGTD